MSNPDSKRDSKSPHASTNTYTNIYSGTNARCLDSNKSCSSELASVMAGEVGGVIAPASSAEGGASVAVPGANSTSNTTTPANYQKLSDEQFKEHAEQIEKVRQIVAKLTKKENVILDLNYIFLFF